jgi:hypothetical protein
MHWHLALSDQGQEVPGAGDLAQGAADRGMTRLGYPRVGGVYPFMSLSRPDCFRPTHLEER